MSDFDYSHLDGKLLQLLLAILDAQSITGAAQRLGVTQSAVSHLLGKLRQITGDPLFVKCGRGIVPTARAEALALHARLLLDDMRRFAAGDEFHPATLHTTFSIAANDFQRDLLLPPLLQRLRRQAPGVRLRVLPSDVPRAEMLREGDCQLVISPRPPDASDILHKRLFEDDYRVFYDAAVREEPLRLADYQAAEHISVLYSPRRTLDVDQQLTARGVARHFAVTVPSFAGIPAFLRGSSMLATLPGLLARGLMQGFAHCPLPAKVGRMPMYMIWHLKYRHDPAHSWLRRELEQAAAEVLGRGTQA